jgi:hypothetical protein
MRRKATTAFLVLLLGILSTSVSVAFQDYRVESVQPNGLPMITYPLYLLGIYLGLLGIGMLVFGVIFMFTPVTSTGFRRAAASSALVAAGVPLILLSTTGIIVNYSEWGTHFCTNPQPDPVCGSIFWITVEFVGIGAAGVASIVTGLYLRPRSSDSFGQ